MAVIPVFIAAVFSTLAALLVGVLGVVVADVLALGRVVLALDADGGARVGLGDVLAAQPALELVDVVGLDDVGEVAVDDRVPAVGRIDGRRLGCD